MVISVADGHEDGDNDENSNCLLELGCGLGVPGMLWYCWKKKKKLQQQEQIMKMDQVQQLDLQEMLSCTL